MSKLYLWSYRLTVSRGWRWDTERTVTKDNADQWLSVFQKGEPNIKFVVSENKPK